MAARAGGCLRAALVPLLCACGGTSSEGEADAGSAAGRDIPPATVDARYLTHVLFVAADGTTLYGSFDQAARGRRLMRTYDVGVAGRAADWTTLLRVQDTLPAPRAAWRVLPAAGMSVLIGDQGQIARLRFSGEGEEAPWQLSIGQNVSDWTGPTGQRESLALAHLDTGEEAISGILFFRRAARALDAPASAAGGRTFLCADSLGNAFLVHEGTPGNPAAAHTWINGAEGSWGRVTLAPVEGGAATGEGGAATGPGWRFEIPEAGLTGSFRPATGESPTGAVSDGRSGADWPRAVRLEALLAGDGQGFRYSGVTVNLPFP